ncbi:unnamed protein product [Heligmosomoides polygyrus]|uniref:DDE Tnp4 domain-containing protein n=1 Tax=Heligmosomoides polygyrus TaxID=6339 RepID=A0A183G2P1_HELPZ|nr:unnamed protein product [Heligmosomoides polygyrus]
MCRDVWPRLRHPLLLASQAQSLCEMQFCESSQQNCYHYPLEKWSRAARRFKENLPRAVGAIDGKYFRCVCPRRSGSSYFIFKGFFSILLLAVVDSDCRVTLMDCGGKGRMSDSGKFCTVEL